MLARDVRIDDFDASDWIALGEILGARGRASREPREGGLLVLSEAGRVSKVVHTTLGRLPPPDAAEQPSLAALAGRHDAAWAVRLTPGATAEFADRTAARIERSDELLGQLRKMLGVLKELAEEGAIETHPKDLRELPVPAERVIARVLDATCPVGKTLLFAAFEGAEVATLIALHRGPSGFDRIVGPEQARRELGLRSGDWTRDARQLARAVELGVGPLALGCFAQTATWKHVLASRSPGTWTAAVAAREIQFHPVAPALAIPLGVDVGRAAFAVAKDLAARLGVASWVAPDGPLRPALDRVREAAAGTDLPRVLGFDPFRLLRELLEPDR